MTQTATTEALRVDDTAPDRDMFLQDVLEGLGGAVKALPCKYLYDETGARLFESICTLDEYYLTAAEFRILRRHGPEMAAHLGERAVMVEFGCGAMEKVRIVLDALSNPAALVAIDISSEQLEAAAASVQALYPRVRVVPVVADFTEPVDVDSHIGEVHGTVCAFFPGSTVGNFEPDDAVEFMGGLRQTVGVTGHLLAGVDVPKDREILVDAYDDPTGVTAAFAINLLARMNRELGADFDRRAFRYRALYEDRFPTTESGITDAGRVRITMFLESLCDQTVTIAGERFHFRAGERLHTENSYKYEVDAFAALAKRAGFRAKQTWLGDDKLFSVHLLEAF